MLRFFFFNFNFFKFCQTGCYVDFFLKKIIEIFVKNFFVFTSLYFGEKYMIEVLTKKVISKMIYISNSYLNISTLPYSFFFLQNISLFFYIFSFINFFIFII